MIRLVLRDGAVSPPVLRIAEDRRSGERLYLIEQSWGAIMYKDRNTVYQSPDYSAIKHFKGLYRWVSPSEIKKVDVAKGKTNNILMKSLLEKEY